MKLKVKLWWVGAFERRKRAFFVLFILSERIFFNICVLSQCLAYWVHFRNIHIFAYKKTLVYTLFCLFLKLSKAFSVFLLLEAEFEDDPLHFPIFYFIYERNRDCAWYIYYILSFFSFLNSQLWLERSYELRSIILSFICPSVHLSFFPAIFLEWSH